MDIYGIGYRDGLTDGLKQSAQQRDDLLAALKEARLTLVATGADAPITLRVIDAAIAKAEGAGNV